MGIPIFLPSDNNYAAPLCTCMMSILSNTKSEINFYILDGGIEKENQEKIKSIKEKFPNFTIEFLKLDIEKLFNNFSTPEGINLATYMRFMIPKLKPELKKVIYMDSDTIALSDIKKLYDEDLEGFALGACFNEVRRKFNSDTKGPMQLSDDYRYFNAGVLLIDIQKWIEDNIVEKLFKIEKKYRNIIPHADESILNKFFDKNYKILSIKYNYTQWDYDFKNEVDTIVVRHYITREKPWEIPVNKDFIFYRDIKIFWHYAKMTPFYDESCPSSDKSTLLNAIIKAKFSSAKEKFMKEKTKKIILERLKNNMKKRIENKCQK